MTQSDVKPTPAASVARRSDLPNLPRRVSGWELVQLVGEGSLTRVYRARPSGSAPGRSAAYALKMLRPEWQGRPEAVALFHREVLVAREVAHPHVVAVLAASVARPPCFVVMPWLTGWTLDALLADQAPLEVPVALWIARQVAEALAAFHSAGWMHGDIKPSNVFLSPEGHVTLLDLGFARRPEETGSAVERCVMGTCNYIAPETITSTLRADIRSDVYSLGAVLFEVLSGRLPFEGKDLAELTTQHRQARPPDLRRLAPQLPSAVARLVRQMLAKEPLRRPQTPAELIGLLVRLEIDTFSERTWE